jgi:hypothetical protein
VVAGLNFLSVSVATCCRVDLRALARPKVPTWIRLLVNNHLEL